MTMTPTERVQRSKEAAHARWGRTVDRTAATAPARKGMKDKWLREAGGDPVRAESLRKAHYARMTRLSIAARRRRTTNSKNTRPAA